MENNITRQPQLQQPMQPKTHVKRLKRKRQDPEIKQNEMEASDIENEQLINGLIPHQQKINQDIEETAFQANQDRLTPSLAVANQHFFKDSLNVNKQFQFSVLTCNEIYCKCTPPQFQYCHKCCSFGVLFCGCGFNCCLCYGCDRIDCASACCAGNVMCCTSCCIVGEIISIITSVRMCKLKIKKRH